MKYQPNFNPRYIRRRLFLKVVKACKLSNNTSLPMKVVNESYENASETERLLAIKILDEIELSLEKQVKERIAMIQEIKSLRRHHQMILEDILYKNNHWK